MIGLSSCKTSADVEGTYLSLFRNNPHKLNIYTAHKFVFSADFTFNYSYIVIGDTEKYSSGTWEQIDKNTIVLNSNIQSNVLPLQVEKVNSEDSHIQVCENLVIIQKISKYEYENEDFLVTPYIDGINYLDLHPELSDEPLQITKNDFCKSMGLETDTINLSEIVMTSPPIKRGSYCIYPEKPFDTLYFKILKQPRKVERMGPRSYKEYYILETEHKKLTTNDGDIVNVTITLLDSLFSYRIFDNEKIKLSGNKLIFKDKEDNNKKNKLYIKD